MFASTASTSLVVRATATAVASTSTITGSSVRSYCVNNGGRGLSVASCNLINKVRHAHLFNMKSQQRKQPNVTSSSSSSFFYRMESTNTGTSTATAATATKESASQATTTTAAAVPLATATSATGSGNKGWWYSAELWGTAGALACWGMAGSAIYDAMNQGPEVISLSLTPVLMIYSTMFTRWALIIQPRNTFLAACHVTNVVAQGNQLRRALEYKLQNGQEQEVNEMIQQAGIGGVFIAGAIAIGPTVRTIMSKAETFGSTIASIAAADAGPFTVHFWAPMSKWLISGASFFDLNRPTDKISLAQYTALTLTGFFFTRYALLVTPINYVLCSVNIAMFGSSGWHLGRKINADYLHIGMDTKKEDNPQ